MTTVSIAFHSGYGHTLKVAEAVAKGAKEQEGADVALIAVDKMTDADWERLNDSDAIVFGSPTYMGGVSAEFKKFADTSSKIWFNRGWVGKVAGGFTNSKSMSGDKLSSLQYMVTFAAQHGMVWISSELPPTNKPGQADELNRLGSTLGVMAQSDDAPAEVTPPNGDLETARIYGKRIAKYAALLKPAMAEDKKAA